MTRPASVARDTGWLLAGRIVVALAGWIGTAVVARRLSPEAWGSYSFVLGLFGILGLVVDLQVGRIVLRQVLTAGPNASRIVGSYTCFRVLVGLSACLLGIAFVVVGGYDAPIVWATAVIGTSLVLMSPAWGLRVWFEARIRLRPVALAMILGAVTQLAVVLVAASSAQPRLVPITMAFVVGQAVVLVSMAVAMRRGHFWPSLTWEPGEWAMWIREAAPLAIGFGLVSIYMKLDLVLLSKLDSIEAVGIYGIGYKFSDLASFIPIALLTPVLTVMVSADERRTIGRHFRQAFALLFVAAVGISVIFALAARPLIELLYGDRYIDGTNSARMLVAAAAIGFITHLCVTALVASGVNRPYALAGLVGLVLNVGLNLALIPALSFRGAAAATVVTEIVVLAILFVALARLPGVVVIPWALMVRTLVAAAGLLVTYLLVATWLPWWLASGTAAASFLALLHALGVDGEGGLRALLRNAHFATDPQVTEPLG